MYNAKDEDSTDELIEYAESDSSTLIGVGVFVGLAVLILILAGLYYYLKRRVEEKERNAVADQEALVGTVGTTRRTRGSRSLTASGRKRARQTTYQPMLSVIAEEE